MMERLTDCQMTMHGVTTRDASIWRLGRLVVAFGVWPRWESATVMLSRSDRERVFVAFHLTWPLPSHAGGISYYHPGIDIRRWRVDFALWLFQFTATFNP